MMRSIFGNWKQPLFFGYTNKNMLGSDSAYISKQGIDAVHGTGMRVRVIVTDGLAKTTGLV